MLEPVAILHGTGMCSLTDCLELHLPCTKFPIVPGRVGRLGLSCFVVGEGGGGGVSLLYFVEVELSSVRAGN